MEMNNRLWRAVDGLTEALTIEGIDRNVIGTAAAYARAYPDADFLQWADRFAQLGETFGSSNQTDRYRRALRDACRQVRPAPQTGGEWAMVLGWAARLYDAQARPAGGDWGQTRRRPPRRRVKPRKPPRTTRKPVSDELPDVREEVSDKAQDIFNKLFGGGDG